MVRRRIPGWARAGKDVILRPRAGPRGMAAAPPSPHEVSHEPMSEFHLYIGNKCFSSWSLRPWIALRHCGIPFEETLIRLRTPATATNLAKVSPTGLVPVLLHG